MGVSIKSDAHILVTQHFGHQLGVRADGEMQGGVRVAEVMEPDLRQASLPQEGPEMAFG